ncbi:MAG: hydantoinase/carbamoylase family amidase [Alphaproteobacteria bacterium]|nr:hydantoinase/carbamoylase family amidase [Alphaproteobacteria bacterium]
MPDDRPTTAAQDSAGSLARAGDGAALARALFDSLRRLSFDGVGITRASYDAGEGAAHEFIAAEARKAGFAVARDRAANLVIELPGSEPGRPVVATGSHLDSVPQGGNFDGAAGVVAGFVALSRIKAAGITPRRTIRLYGIRGEESAWFGKAYLGSSALFGRLDPLDLERRHRDTGKPLATYMEAAGADIVAIASGEPLARAEDFAAFVEVHIEQGPVLVDRALPVGIVTGIRGYVRHLKIVCHGEAGHSGAIPRWLRHDSVLAVADVLMRLDEHWRVLMERGIDLVITSGIFTTDPSRHAMSRIPGEVEFSLEFRSLSLDTLETFHRLVQTECDVVAKTRGVRFEFDRRVFAVPERIGERWIEHLDALAKRLEIPTCRMPSGPGHDAAIFLGAGVPSAMIFIRNAHGSHNPREAMAIEDFMRGVDLLQAALLDPAA